MNNDHGESSKPVALDRTDKVLAYRMVQRLEAGSRMERLQWRILFSLVFCISATGLAWYVGAVEDQSHAVVLGLIMTAGLETGVVLQRRWPL